MKVFLYGALAAVACGYSLIESGACADRITSDVECIQAVRANGLGGVDADAPITSKAHKSRTNACYLKVHKSRGTSVHFGQEKACSAKNPCICRDTADTEEAFDSIYHTDGLKGKSDGAADSCSPIATADECKEAAFSVGATASADTMPTTPRASRRGIRGCYVKRGVAYWSAPGADNNLGRCSSGNLCVCGQRTNQPTPAPTLEPTPNWSVQAGEDSTNAQEQLPAKEDAVGDATGCVRWITDADTCKKAATATAGIPKPLVDALFTIQPNMATGNTVDPPYCYIEGGVVKFNQEGGNTGACGNDKCLCLGH